MAKRTQTNTGRRETDNKRRKKGARTNRTNRQMKRIIGGILGEQGKDRMYEEKGAGRENERTAGRDGKENEDKTEGQDEDKNGPAGRDKTKTEDEPGGQEGKVRHNEDVTNTARATINKNIAGQAEDKEGPAKKGQNQDRGQARGARKEGDQGQASREGRGRAPGPRHQGHQRPLLLPPSHARTGGGPR